MTQTGQAGNVQHLQKLFNQRSPKTKYITQSRVEQFTDSITKQIINGDTVVNPIQDKSNFKPKNRYEEQIRRHQLVQASKQREELQRKLSYVNRSIDSIKQYSYLKASRQTDLNNSSSKSPPQLQALRLKSYQNTLQLKKHKEKLQKVRKQQQQRKKRQQQQQLAQRKQQIQEQKQRKKKQILLKMKKIKKQMQSREQQHLKSTEKVKQILLKKQLFQKMQDKFKQQQNSTLQQRKRKLALIRTLHKPIDSHQILQHQKKVLQLKKEKEDIRQREKKINQSAVKYKVPYTSSYYKQIVQKKSAEMADPMTTSKIKVDKIKQFAEHIRQNFIPHVDQRKKKQIQDYKEKQIQSKRSKEQRQQQTIQMIKLKGTEYLDQMRKIPKRRNPIKMQQQGSKTARTVYKNYLEHSNEQIGSPHRTEKTWSKILSKKQLNKKQKARLLQFESQRMESYLKRKQQQSRLLKKNNQEDIDQQYYQMIKAKLNLLTSD